MPPTRHDVQWMCGAKAGDDAQWTRGASWDCLSRFSSPSYGTLSGGAASGYDWLYPAPTGSPPLRLNTGPYCTLCDERRPRLRSSRHWHDHASSDIYSAAKARPNVQRIFACSSGDRLCDNC